MRPAALLGAVGIRVAYGGAVVLDVPALDVRDGEVLAVIGPNGSGKSTLLRVLGLLEIPTTGEIRLRDRAVDARHALEERRRMAAVFQRPLLADMSVAENVALGLRFRGVAGGEVTRRVERWLARLAVAHLHDRRARTLSGGEAQRVALARALVLEPEVLLLDEPFAAIDQPSRAALVPDLARVLREDRTTTVLVTHDRAEALALADRVAVLLDGRLRQLDTTARVFYAPASEAVARFVGVETIVDGRVIAADDGLAVVDVGGRRLVLAAALRSGDRVRVGIRPEDVMLQRTPTVAGASSPRNHLPGTIARVTPSTPHVHVVVDCGFPLVAAATPRAVLELGLREGVPVVAVIETTAPHVLALLDTPTRAAL